ncbi:MAG: hypothetical protein N2442_04815 [Spirochaetes bacterium]|nr:hypothetical protein [Spirochaetota bacterium]
MLITDELLGDFFVRLGLITEEQKKYVLDYKQQTGTTQNFYQIAIKFQYLVKGSLDAALERFTTPPLDKKKEPDKEKSTEE